VALRDVGWHRVNLIEKGLHSITPSREIKTNQGTRSDLVA